MVCYAVSTFLIVSLFGSSPDFYERREARKCPCNKEASYESGCYGRWGRIEAKTIDDQAPEADGSYRWQTSDGTYPQPSQTPRHYGSCDYCSVFGEQHRRLFWQRFPVRYAYYLFTRRCAAGDGGKREKCGRPAYR